MKKSTVIICGVFAAIVIYILFHSLMETAKERDVFEANEIAVSQAYSKHLYIEYRKAMCGVDKTYDENAFPQDHRRLLTGKQASCLPDAKQKAMDKVAEATAKK